MRELRTMHAGAWLTAIGILVFATLFGALGVRNHQHFGTWSYDMGIYDQAFWLVSRGGDTFITVRGLDVWGHHVNLVAYAFAPFYWLGAGPSFLYVVQAIALALGAWPMYLIARDRFTSGWMGAVFAVAYLLYAPVQWISWAMFHPEALVITPFLFAWWFGTRGRWGWCTAMVVLALAMREDTALAVMMMAIALAVTLRRNADVRSVLRRCAGLFVLGGTWYVVATRLVLPHFNGGQPPFYVTYFYGNYGDTTTEIIGSMLRHPGRVLHDATRHDRLSFYWQLGWPTGWLALLSPLGLLMAVPQMVASVIGLSPYARMINYQYTAVMVGPIMIASVEGAWLLWRFRAARRVLPIWLVACALVTNAMWSPSPMNSDGVKVWAGPNDRDASMEAALAAVPDDASVTATYRLVPHLTHRREVYDWPSPFKSAVWGNMDCVRLPSSTSVDYAVLDKRDISAEDLDLYLSMRKLGGPFEVVYEDDDAITMHRVGTTPEVDEQPQRDSCREVARQRVLRGTG